LGAISSSHETNEFGGRPVSQLADQSKRIRGAVKVDLGIV
jgi:hypothetical protein